MLKITKALVECPLNNNITYSCSNPYPNCTSSLGFQFSSVWDIQQRIYEACPNDWRLFGQAIPALSQAGCEQVAGPSWTYYSGADIWSRLTTWKFPLLQLVAIFPRPPLSFRAEAFVIFHLLGNPVSTMRDLLLKFASCERRAEFWQHQVVAHSLGSLLEEEDDTPYYTCTDRAWKALAMITDAFDEWGQEAGNAARDFLFEKLTSNDLSHDQKKEFMRICQKTSNALAADRTTKFFPVIVAQSFFIGSVGIAFARTQIAAAAPNPSTFINIEAHSIAFTCLLFWVVPAVFMASVIGVSQTENAIPRILQRLQMDIEIAFEKWDMFLPTNCLGKAAEGGKQDSAVRERSGGIYSWQPEGAPALAAPLGRDRDLKSSDGPQTQTMAANVLQAIAKLVRLRPGSPVFPLLIVTAGAIAGPLISYLVPPVGFEGRHIGEIMIYEPWLLSAALDYIKWGKHHRWLFWFTFVKDFLVAGATMGEIIAAQVGIFNRCSCYTLWGKTGLALPQMPIVVAILVARISTTYPAIAFVCVSFQLVVFPAIVVLQFPHAVRTFMQRDDNTSNLQAWHAIRDHFGRQDGSIYRRGARFLQKGTPRCTGALKRCFARVFSRRQPGRYDEWSQLPTATE